MQNIMDEQVQSSFMVHKIILLFRVGDWELYLKTFQTQMFISSGSNTERCRIFVRTFAGTDLQWLNNISNHSIPSFHKNILEQFTTNKVKSPKIVNLFDKENVSF